MKYICVGGNCKFLKNKKKRTNKKLVKKCSTSDGNPNADFNNLYFYFKGIKNKKAVAVLDKCYSKLYLYIKEWQKSGVVDVPKYKQKTIILPDGRRIKI